MFISPNLICIYVSENPLEVWGSPADTWTGIMHRILMSQYTIRRQYFCVTFLMPGRMLLIKNKSWTLCWETSYTLFYSFCYLMWLFRPFLASMNWFYVCQQVTFLCERGSTMCALKLLAFMNWFHVFMKVSFSSECGSTMCALKLLAFMNWFNVCL